MLDKNANGPDSLKPSGPSFVHTVVVDLTAGLPPRLEVFQHLGNRGMPSEPRPAVDDPGLLRVHHEPIVLGRDVFGECPLHIARDSPRPASHDGLDHRVVPRDSRRRHVVDVRPEAGFFHQRDDLEEASELVIRLRSDHQLRPLHRLRQLEEIP